jgi:hypothetical protein
MPEGIELIVSKTARAAKAAGATKTAAENIRLVDAEKILPRKETNKPSIWRLTFLSRAGERVMGDYQVEHREKRGRPRIMCYPAGSSAVVKKMTYLGKDKRLPELLALKSRLTKKQALKRFHVEFFNEFAEIYQAEVRQEITSLALMRAMGHHAYAVKRKAKEGEDAYALIFSYLGNGQDLYVGLQALALTAYSRASIRHAFARLLARIYFCQQIIERPLLDVKSENILLVKSTDDSEIDFYLCDLESSLGTNAAVTTGVLTPKDMATVTNVIYPDKRYRSVEQFKSLPKAIDYRTLAALWVECIGQAKDFDRSQPMFKRYLPKYEYPVGAVYYGWQLVKDGDSRSDAKLFAALAACEGQAVDPGELLRAAYADDSAAVLAYEQTLLECQCRYAALRDPKRPEATVSGAGASLGVTRDVLTEQDAVATRGTVRLQATGSSAGCAGGAGGMAGVGAAGPAKLG